MFVKRIIMTFYKYFIIRDVIKIYTYINDFAKKRNILGRIYIASEGFNVHISVPLNYFDEVKFFFRSLHNNLYKIHYNCSLEHSKIAFFKLKIKIKKQIVSSKINNFCFLNEKKCIYLDTKNVNSFLLNSDVVFVDVRNSYEYNVGRFPKAIEIPSKTYRQQLSIMPMVLEPYKYKKIVLYCTGGVRCEKASVLLKKNNFKFVYQIYGGILNYLNDSKKNGYPILFKGKVFVFDNRLVEVVTNDILSPCKTCNKYIYNSYINCRNQKCHDLFLQCVYCKKKFKSCCSKECLNLISI